MPPVPPPAPMSPFPPPPMMRPPNWWQRNWKWFVPTGCFTLLALVVGFILFIVLIVMGAMKSNDAYKGAVARAKADARVVQALGDPVSEGLFTGGNVNVNGGSGNADLSIPLSGPKAKGTLHAVATKSGGDWDYSAMTVKVDGSGETIDLLDTR